MIPIAKPWIDDEEIKAVEEVLRSGMLAMGEWVERFEKKFADYIGVKHAVAVSNGTQALILALEAIGIEGKEVLVPSFTFISTATSVIRAGGKPVFVDVDPKTFNIDVEDVRRKITEKTIGIIPVHLFGQPADLDGLLELAEDKGLFVLEDACQAHGAEWKGKKVGGFGLAAAFSFYPTKNMTTGEGGMVTTNDEELAEKIRMLRNHGQRERYLHVELGWNYRMTNLQAAIGLVQLKKLDRAIELRRKNARFYDEALQGIEGIETPYVRPGVKHVYHQYTLKVDNREELLEKFRRAGVGYGIYYPRGIHQQPIMKKLGFTAKLPVTESLVERVVSIPVYPQLTEEERQKIVDVIKGL